MRNCDISGNISDQDNSIRGGLHLWDWPNNENTARGMTVFHTSLSSSCSHCHEMFPILFSAWIDWRLRRCRILQIGCNEFMSCSNSDTDSSHAKSLLKLLQILNWEIKWHKRCAQSVVHRKSFANILRVFSPGRHPSSHTLCCVVFSNCTCRVRG